MTTKERVAAVEPIGPHRLGAGDAGLVAGEERVGLGPRPRLGQELPDLGCGTGQQGLGKPDPFLLQFAHHVEGFVAFLRL